MAFFPMFVDITNEECLVVGGGSVALRKVKLLLDFEAMVTVVASAVGEDIKALVKEGNVSIFERDFLDSDIKNKKLVIVATSDRECNQRVASLCESSNIPVNVVDDIEECSFIVPSYVKEHDLTAAFSSSGKSPALTQYLKAKEQEVLTPFLGELNDLLGSVRCDIKTKFDSEEEKKVAYNKIITYALTNEVIPDKATIEELIDEV